MVGAIQSLTTNFSFNKINFDWVTWHPYEWDNWDQLDAILNVAVGYLNIVGVWRPQFAYTAGQVVIDPDDLVTLWEAQDNHTSGTDFDAQEKLDHWATQSNPGAQVTSVFGRIGAIAAEEADYSAFYPLIADLVAVNNALLSHVSDTANPHVTSWSNLTGKPSTFPPDAHTHPISEVVNLQTELDGKAASAHTHIIADVTGLQTALDGKAPAVHTHTEAQITDLDKYTQAEVDAAIAAAVAAAANGNVIETVDANNSPTVEFINLSATGFRYEIDMDNLIPEVNNRTLTARTSTNNGSNWNGGTNHYSWVYFGRTAGGAYFDDDSTGDTLIRMIPTMGNLIDSESSGKIIIINPSRNKHTIIQWEMGYWDSSGAWNTLWGHGVRLANQVVNAIQIAYDADNIDTGTFKLRQFKA